jgi:peptidoglycan/xylan/chitin deacetylase (PgdA/CDA1 family)
MLGYAFSALGTLAAATAAGWASMDPRSQLYGRTFIGRKDAASRKLLALTYDDGPNDRHTAELLEVLARHGVRATFFMIGNYVNARPAIARAVAQAGHEIGNHTFSHPNLALCSPAKVERELAACETALTDAVGEDSRLFRPPFGGRRPDVLDAVRRLSLQPVMWSVSACDWKLPSASAIEEQVARHTRGGDVILMHDGSHRRMGMDRENTVRATDSLIRRMRDAGYEFCTVTQMMKGL